MDFEGRARDIALDEGLKTQEYAGIARFSNRTAGAIERLCVKRQPSQVELAGMAGFEPTNARVKVWCLTAWRHPNVNAPGIGHA